LTLAEQGSFRGILLPALPTLSSPAARDLLADALVRRNDRELAAALLTAWNTLSPRVRNQLLESALRDAARLGDLLGVAGRDAAFREQLGPAFRTAAREHRDPVVREAALRLFGPMTSANVEERRRHFASALVTSGDAVRGRVIYQVRCASCHRAAGEGFAVGPDLLTVAAAGRDSLLTGLLEPQREVAPRYEAWVAKLTNGEEVTGLLTEERPDGVTLRSGGGVERRLARASVVSLASTGRSLMPEGLDEGLGPGEMADLLRFIESLIGPTSLNNQ
jgi:putative heme-binding domain-containing protein